MSNNNNTNNTALRKGQVVVVVTPTEGVRPMTAAEEAAWYDHAYKAWGPHDAAGEPWVTHGIKRVSVAANTRLEIVRGRVSARYGWYDRPGYAEVVNLATGEHLKVPRSALRAVNR
jgi:hypothetical protein